MKRRYGVLILALAGLFVCHSTKAQQMQPALGAESAGAPAPAAPADPLQDPNCQRRFEAMFGPEALKVDMSASKIDDADFAEKLAAAAAKSDGDTGFQVYLYDKVYIFGLRLARTQALAQQAIARLDSLAPQQRRRWEDYRLELCRLLHRQSKVADHTSTGEGLIAQLIVGGDLRAEAGKWNEAIEFYQQAVQTASQLRSQQKDAAAEKINQANRMKEVLALRQRLEHNPADTKLRISVIDAHLGLLDDPGGAAELLNPDVGEAYRTYVPLAARFPGELTPDLLMELGNWYKTLARQATSALKPTLARRTADYYLAYIAGIRRQGATISAVQAAITKINASLKEIGQDKLPDKVFFRDPVVQSSFDKALKWLWNAQAPDGSWITHKTSEVGYHATHNTISTAAVLAALLGGGASIDDARSVKAVRWLEAASTRQIDGLACRCLAWQEVQKLKPGRAGQLLAGDVSILIRACYRGGYGETMTSGKYTSFGQSWQAPLGVDAGEQCGLRAQRTYWQQVAAYWAGQQGGDGGMGPYQKGNAKDHPSPANTIIGAGSLAIALGRLYGPEALKNPSGAQSDSLGRALGWLDKNLTALSDLKPPEDPDRKKGDYPPAHIVQAGPAYMLSRLGLATGRDRLGQVKWWSDGGRFLAGLQKADGSWEYILDTALVTLAMIDGYKFEQANFGSLPARIPGATTKPATTQGAGERPTALDASDLRKRLQRRESDLKSRLKANPDSKAAAERLVRLYVLEMHEPRKALEYADQAGNFMAKRLIGLLDKDMSILYPCELLGMGNWQMELADGAPDVGRKLALARAVACYRSYLARKPAIPTDATKARASMEEAREALADMGGQ